MRLSARQRRLAAHRKGRLLALSAAFASLALLPACGGGGGDDGGGNPPSAPTPSPPPPAPSPATATLGGTLRGVANLVVDSDTNDVNQQGRAANDHPTTAQNVSASGQVVGTVNTAGAGSDGASFDDGDRDDYFKIHLAAGQTVQLDMTSDTEDNDVDLYIYQLIGSDYQPVGASYGTTRNECVQITADGEYYVNPYAYAGASIYNLRIAAPGAGGACSNSTSTSVAGSLRAGEVILGLKATADTGRAQRASVAVADAGLTMIRGALAPGHMGLATLPADPAARRRVLSAGATRPTSTVSTPLPGMADAMLLRDTINYAKRLRQSGRYDYVMLNRTLSTQTLIGTYPPNDPSYDKQRWHYEQISVPAALQTLTALSPQPTVRPVVAVIDTGVVTDHPDLEDQLVTGYDFIADPDTAGDGNGIDGNPDDLQDNRGEPVFHGSHVAGTIAAETYNGIGGGGVAPMAQIMPLRVLGVGGTGSFYDIIQGVLFAAGLSNDSGRTPGRRADVINMSLGAAGAACDSDSADLFAEVRAQGTIVVAAAGNDSDRRTGRVAPVGYPANCDGVIAVGATDPRREVTFYSSSGPETRVAAPGGDSRYSTTGTGLPDGVFSTVATFKSNGDRVPTYTTLDGTSMASPHVAGVMALMRWANPAITPSEVDALLADGQLTDAAGATGRDEEYGYGIINASKAVNAALALAGGSAPPPGSLQLQPGQLDFGTSAETLQFVVSATSDTDETVTSISSSSGAVTVSEVDVDGATGRGRYQVTIDRDALPEGASTPTVTVETSERTLTLQLSVDNTAGAAPTGDLGPLYVIVLDGETGDVLTGQTVQPSSGSYEWQIGDISASSVLIFAGTDYDNDGYICNSGELCGAYPVLGASVEPIAIDGDRDDLSFLLSPIGAGSASSTAVDGRSTPAAATVDAVRRGRGLRHD